MANQREQRHLTTGNRKAFSKLSCGENFEKLYNEIGNIFIIFKHKKLKTLKI
jgi:hypothetical protein